METLSFFQKRKYGVMIHQSERIKLLVTLGEFLKSDSNEINETIEKSYQNNKWFTIENQLFALRAIANQFLNEKILTQFTQKYSPIKTKKNIGLIPAGNLPLVGFHDWMCIFLSGHSTQIKLSDKDPFWMPLIIQKLNSWDSNCKNYFYVVDNLKDFDAIIATGSDNSSRYFEYYFSKVPNIIRKNRNSIAVLTGNESVDDLEKLSKDVFTFFGLGCRNVSKIYVPKEYDFNQLLEVFHENNSIVHQDKYKNNFDYNIVLFMMNKIKYLNNGCIILTENTSLSSRIATLNYEFYDNTESLKQEILENSDKIQCVVTDKNLGEIKTIPFGKSQQPDIDDFADGIDTMEFLSKL